MKAFRMKITLLSALAALLFSTGAALRGSASPSEFPVDSFSAETGPDGLPEGWKELTFKKIPSHTRYSVVEVDGNFALKAESRASASGLLKEIRKDPREFSILRWRWKIDGVVEKADARKKDGDDYAARVYVAFKYDPDRAGAWEKAKYGSAKLLFGEYPPKAALNYVWDNRLEAGSAFDNAYTGRAKMVVVRSGNGQAGQWVAEERDILEDYRKLFGEEPPEIAFIALMTDTDNTRGSATAYFDDIALAAK